jgi:hypothetical protein
MKAAKLKQRKERLLLFYEQTRLNENHCNKCEDNPANRGGADYTLRKDKCYNECPIGLQLREIGEKLIKGRGIPVKVMSADELEDNKVRTGKDSTGEAGKSSKGVVKRPYGEEPDKTKFLMGIAEGNTIAATEKAMGMKHNSIYHWIRKWELTGIKQDRARELLGLDPVSAAAEKPEPPKVGAGSNTEREIEDLKAAAQHWQDAATAKDSEIARLQKQLDQAAKHANQNAETAARCATELVKAKDEARKEIERLNEAMHGAAVIADQAGARIRELEGENDRLHAQLEAAAGYAEGVPVEHDPVNHPAHYTAGGIECIDAIEAATTGLTGGQAYATGAAIKYLWRWSRKNGVEDLEKAAWYVKRLIGEVERG